MAEYIEREAAIKCAEKSYKMWNLTMAAADGAREINKCYKMQELCKTIGEIFKIVLAADVAPVVHAHWIDKWKCSACGEISYEEAKSDETDPNCYYVLSDYCPNCGAKMDEEESHDKS